MKEMTKNIILAITCMILLLLYVGATIMAEREKSKWITIKDKQKMFLIWDLVYTYRNHPYFGENTFLSREDKRRLIKLEYDLFNIIKNDFQLKQRMKVMDKVYKDYYKKLKWKKSVWRKKEKETGIFQQKIK